jgi:hypothetical protein
VVNCLFLIPKSADANEALRQFGVQALMFQRDLNVRMARALLDPRPALRSAIICVFAPAHRTFREEDPDQVGSSHPLAPCR